MAAQKIKTRASLHGWIQNGQFISYPDAYNSKREEAKSITEATIYSAKSIIGKGDLNANFMITLEKYQNQLENFEKDSSHKTYFENFFTKVDAFAVSLASSPNITNTSGKMALGNRSNILIAVRFAMEACAHPEILMNTEELVNRVDFEAIYPIGHARNKIYKDLCKKLAHNSQNPEEFIIGLMSYYMEAYNTHIVNRIKKGLVPLN